MTGHQQSAAARRLGWTLAVALGACAAAMWVQSFHVQGGVDFYHFWGIAAARAEGGAALGTPYADGARYAELLIQRADASPDVHFKRANQARRAIDPTGTPLLYASFAVLPADYTRAHAWYRAVQLVCLCAAVALLCRALGLPLPESLALAFTVAIAYQPAQSEATVGNVNSLQLLACVGFALQARRIGRRTGGRAVAGSVLLALGVAFALLKPNLVLLPLLLAPFLARVLGRRAFAMAAAVALLFGVALVALSSGWMGTPRAWLQWWDFVRGPGGAKIAAYPVANGNFSASVLLSGDGPASSAHTTSLVLGVVLAFSWLAAAWEGRTGLGLAARASELLDDPLLLVSTALLVTLAAAPLVWFHYCVLALLPCLWLAFAEESTDLPALLGLLSLGLYAGLLAPLVEPLGLGSPRLQFLAWSVGFAWVPAWSALLLRLARPLRTH
jgi:hypothetical protein